MSKLCDTDVSHSRGSLHQVELELTTAQVNPWLRHFYGYTVLLAAQTMRIWRLSPIPNSLEVLGRSIAERRMQPTPVVVAFDKMLDPLGQVLHITVVVSVDLFAL